MNSKRVKLTAYDNGSMLIEPYNESDKPRYQPLLELEFGTLTTTQSHYRLLLRWPRKESPMETINHLMTDISRVSEFLIDTLVAERGCNHD